MAEKSTIARPYAQAVFELAREQGKLKEWSAALQELSAVCANADVASVIQNPGLDRAVIADVVIAACGKALNADSQNLVKVLAENRRLDVAGEILVQFEVQRAEAEKTVDAEVISAFEVSKGQQDKIAAALKARLGREVKLSCRVDESLIGGAIIRAGDMVIDGSAAGHMKSLATALA